MPTDFYMSAVAKGEKTTFSKQNLRAILARGAITNEWSSYLQTDFCYEDGHVSLDFDELPEQLSDILARYVFGVTAWTRLIEVATELKCFMYWPSGEDHLPFVGVANEDMLAELPTDVLAVDPPVAVVTTVESLCRAMGIGGPGTREEWQHHLARAKFHSR